MPRATCLLPLVVALAACDDTQPTLAPDLALACNTLAPDPTKIVLPPLPGLLTPVRGARRTVVDPTRTVDGAPRRIAVEVWYPADACAAGPPAPYGDETEAHSLGLDGRLADVRTHTITGAPFADGPPRPLLLFSPGYSFQPRSYTAYMEALTSLGYVVAAISHPLWTPVATLADGTIISSTHDANDLDGVPELAVWTADARAVLDAMLAAAIDDPLGELAGHVDVARIGMFGHSFGGATAIALAATDTRIAAAVDLDGSLFGTIPAPTHPVLFFRSERPMDLSWPPVYDSATGGALSLELVGAVHKTFSDGPLIKASSAGALDGTRAISVVNAYLRAFFDHSLRGTTEPLLDAPSPSYPEVELDRRAAP